MGAVNWKDFKGAIERNIHFSKGDSGRVLVVAGEAPGAAVLAARAALRGGADSAYVLAPERVAPALAAANPDLVVRALPGEALSEKHAKAIQEQAARADVLLIGPGLGEGCTRLVAEVVAQPDARLVLDADATKVADLAQLKNALVLANTNEYELLGEPAPGENVLLVKGPVDLVISKTNRIEIEGGHPRATVNGTGDVLAGLAAALAAQMEDIFLAAQAASFLLKKAAEGVADTLHYGWLASDLVEQLPKTLYEYRIFRATKHQPTEMMQAIKRGRSLWTWRGGEKQKKAKSAPKGP